MLIQWCYPTTTVEWFSGAIPHPPPDDDEIRCSVVGNHEARERAQKRLNALREVAIVWGEFWIWRLTKATFFCSSPGK